MSSRIIPKLGAPEPSWYEQTDVVVIGSGVAGLTAAIYAHEAGYRVMLITKARIEAGSTQWAQGGIAAALSPDDTPEEHWRDTIVAGAGLCDPDAVRVLVSEGPQAIRRLIKRGARFDKDDSGQLQLTREGGHLRDRIAHAGGDATGAEISRALIAASKLERVEIIEHALVLDLLVDATGAAQGVTLHVMGKGKRDGVGAVLAPAIVMATGGIGQVYKQSTNPLVATGDGIAMALRAGAEVADIEFVQFHPTVLYTGANATGQLPLISEAVRGEGAVLLTLDGEKLMEGLHPLADLAPRDIVAKAIHQHLIKTSAEHVWLDGRNIAERWPERFPTIFASLQEHGIDPRVDLIPVAPAQHYHSGGVLTDLYGRTSVTGLFACGEVACTGVHGANRLASNSLLEGLVFAERIGAVLAGGLPTWRPVVNMKKAAGLISESRRKEIQRNQSRHVGVTRNADGLKAANLILDAILTTSTEQDACTENWEASNLHTLAVALTAAARARTESRGSHIRDDYPDTSGEWLQRVVIHANNEGELVTRLQPIPQILDSKEVL
jgi:L-aspartate oxidase